MKGFYKAKEDGAIAKANQVSTLEGSGSTPPKMLTAISPILTQL